MLERLKKFNAFDSKQRKINYLKNQVDLLESAIKDDLYKEFMKRLGEPIENGRLKKENKRLRSQVKSLKEIIKESK